MILKMSEGEGSVHLCYPSQNSNLICHTSSCLPAICYSRVSPVHLSTNITAFMQTSEIFQKLLARV